jgi:hypothetical protein
MKIGLMIGGVITALVLGIARYGNPMARTEDCVMPSAPHVMREQSNILLQYWLVENRPQFYESTLPSSPPLLAFRERINASIDVEPSAVLERQLPYVSGGDAENVRRVLRSAGSIRTMNCLEALLLATQAERSTSQGRSMYTHPTEFSSYVLRRGNLLKIWHYTVDQPGIRGLVVLHDPLMADVQQGWVVVTHIHNHNFFPDTERVLGGVAPSATDIQYLRNVRGSLGVTRAVIVNGFHSIDIFAADFDRFVVP